MNYYGTEKHKEYMKKLYEQIFSKIRFDKPKREKELESVKIILSVINKGIEKYI